MRTSPCWTYASRHHQLQLRRQLGQRLRFGFSRQPCTKTAISPTSELQMRRSLMRWKADYDGLLLVLVLAPEDSWIILCDHEKVLRHLCGPSWAFVSSRALSPSCGQSPQVASNPSSSTLGYKLSSRRHLQSGFV